MDRHLDVWKVELYNIVIELYFSHILVPAH